MSDITKSVSEPADAELAASALCGPDVSFGTEWPLRLHLAGQTGEVEVPQSALAHMLNGSAHGEGLTACSRRQS